MECSRAIEYLVSEQGVSRELVKTLEQEGFRHTTMICPDVFEQMEYEKQLRIKYTDENIRIITLKDNGMAYWVRG